MTGTNEKEKSGGSSVKQGKGSPSKAKEKSVAKPDESKDKLSKLVATAISVGGVQGFFHPNPNSANKEENKKQVADDKSISVICLANLKDQKLRDDVVKAITAGHIQDIFLPNPSSK